MHVLVNLFQMSSDILSDSFEILLRAYSDICIIRFFRSCNDLIKLLKDHNQIIFILEFHAYKYTVLCIKLLGIQ